ncbi:hypothetical protein [Gynuella sp.]|uniref:hypothetical protein n=1 Tax=Gynuella sp. TaxID=2969146 RepID=UPI003D101AC9
MIDVQSYMVAWLIYIAAGLVFMLAASRILRGIKPVELKGIVFGWMAVIIFVPYRGHEPAQFIAPAILVAAFDFLDGLDKGLDNALALVLERMQISILAFILVTIAGVAALIIRMSRRKLQVPDSAGQSSE